MQLKEVANSNQCEDLSRVTSEVASCFNVQGAPCPLITPEILTKVVDAFDVSRGIAEDGVSPFHEWLTKVVVSW